MRGLDLRRELSLLSRFGGAGVLTTALGLAVILALDLGLGIDRRAANAAGYLAGALLGLALQRRFVFRHQDDGAGVKLRFVAAMAVAYLLNQIVLQASGHVLPPSKLGRAAAQLLAMGSYTTAQFALFRLWVFRRPA